MILSSEAEERAPFTTEPSGPPDPGLAGPAGGLVARWRGWILAAIATLVLASLLLSYLSRPGGDEVAAPGSSAPAPGPTEPSGPSTPAATAT